MEAGNPDLVKLEDLEASRQLTGRKHIKVIAPGMFVEHREKVEVRARVAEETFKSGLRSWQIEGGWRISLAHRPEEFVVAEARSVDLVIIGRISSCRLDVRYLSFLRKRRSYALIPISRAADSLGFPNHLQNDSK